MSSIHLFFIQSLKFKTKILKILLVFYKLRVKYSVINSVNNKLQLLCTSESSKISINKLSPNIVSQRLNYVINT